MMMMTAYAPGLELPEVDVPGSILVEFFHVLRDLAYLGLRCGGLVIRQVLLDCRVRRLDPLLPIVVAGYVIGITERCVVEPRTPENTSDRVVVLSWDRVELMIMTAGTGNSQAHEAASQGVDTIVKFVRQGTFAVGVLVVLGTESKEAKRHQVLIGILVCGAEQIASNL